LSTLWLHSNEITTIDPDAFSACKGLQLLGVGGNSFTSLPRDAFAGLPSIQTIALNLCPNLETIQSGAFPLESEDLKEVRLSGNHKLTLVEPGFLTGKN
jgi:Leucine-rich repeat (LRR) protein